MRPYVLAFAIAYVGLLVLLSVAGYVFRVRLQGEIAVVPAALIALWRFFLANRRNLEPPERRALLNGSWLAAVLVQVALTLYVVLTDAPAGMSTASAALVFGLALVFTGLLYYGALWLCYGPLANYYARRLFGR
jgi:hypothetical protein